MRIHCHYTSTQREDPAYSPNYLYLIQGLSREVSQYFHTHWHRISSSILQSEGKDALHKLEASFYILDQQQWSEICRLLRAIEDPALRTKAGQLMSEILADPAKPEGSR